MKILTNVIVGSQEDACWSTVAAEDLVSTAVLNVYAQNAKIDIVYFNIQVINRLP